MIATVIYNKTNPTMTLRLGLKGYTLDVIMSTILQLLFVGKRSREHAATRGAVDQASYLRQFKALQYPRLIRRLE